MRRDLLQTPFSFIYQLNSSSAYPEQFTNSEYTNSEYINSEAVFSLADILHHCDHAEHARDEAQTAAG